MALESIIKRILILDDLIKQQRTGKVTDLAEALGVSERQAYNYISRLNKIGKGARYDPEKNSYVYEEACEERAYYDAEK